MAEISPENGDLKGESSEDRFANDPEMRAIIGKIHEIHVAINSDSEEDDAVDMEKKYVPYFRMTPEEKLESDKRSIFVGNLHYGASAEELEILFSDCGTVTRVTIVTDRISNLPKGYAYVEFSDQDAVQTATGFSTTLFKKRLLKVQPKRRNKHDFQTKDQERHHDYPPDKKDNSPEVRMKD